MGNESLVKWFLEHGADPNIHGAKNECPLDVTAYECNCAVVELLLQHGATIKDSNALHAAAKSREDDSACILMITYLLDHGADINALEDQGSRQYTKRMDNQESGTALHCAVRARKKECVRFLLECGANPRVLDTAGFDAMD